MTATGAVMFALLGTFNLGLTALVLHARPRRDVHALVAALIGTNGVYALYRVLFEVGILFDAAPSAFAAAVPLLLNLPVFAAFITLPLVFPRERFAPRWRPLFRRAVLAFVAINAALVVLYMALTGDLTGINGVNHFLFGPTAWLPFLAGVGVGMVLLLDVYLGAEEPALRTQVALVLAAFALKAATHWSAPPFREAFGIFGELDTTSYPVHSFAWYAILFSEAVLFLGLTGLALGLVSRRVRRWRRGLPAPAWREDALLVAIMVLGLALGLGNVAGDIDYLVLRPLLLTYGILHFELIPVDVERRRPLVAGTMFAGLGGIFLVITNLFSAWDIAPDARAGLAFLAAAALGGTLAWPLVRITVAPLAALSAERSRELYRAALAQVVADGTGTASSGEGVLRALRERLRISEREHAELLAEAEAGAGRPGELAPGTTFLGRYAVEAPLGEGGFARAFLARDQRLGRRVVLKVAHLARPEETKRALREARLLAAVAHPNIVAVHDIEEVAGEVVLVLEHVPGGSLAELLKQGKVPAERAVGIARDVLAALAAAHARGIVHRDVKPSNVLLAGGRAKLADFGIAAGPQASLTVSGSFTRAGAGTLRYMAPEQARGLDADARSDLYAVGVLLHEMLTGKPYLRLEGLADFEVRRAILEQEPALPVRGAPRGVNRALRQALAKDPAGRPASAEDFRRGLEA